MLTFAKLSPHEVNLIFLQIRGCCQTLAKGQGFQKFRNGEPYFKPSYN